MAGDGNLLQNEEVTTEVQEHNTSHKEFNIHLVPISVGRVLQRHKLATEKNVHDKNCRDTMKNVDPTFAYLKETLNSNATVISAAC